MSSSPFRVRRPGLALALLFALLLPLAACDSDGDDEVPDLDDLIEARGDLETLQAALAETGLDATLDGDDTFTVFAPTDDAFADLLAQAGLTEAELLDYDDLESLLLFHVSPNVLGSSELAPGDVVATAFGTATFTVVAAGTGLGIDVDGDGAAEARITTTDLEAENGVVHLLDAVLVPESLRDGLGLGDGATAEVTVMSYNLYLGADIFELVGAEPGEVFAVAAQLFADVQETDFPARAAAIADLIAEADPALIGLQEVSLYRTQTPSDIVTGTLEPNATDVAFDFLQILLDALDAEGLRYDVVASTTNADVEVPASTDGETFTDIRLTDRDVILAREGVATSSPVEENFDVFVPIAVGDFSVDFLRGYNSVVATVDEVDFTFANAHLEVEIEGAPLQPQEAQAQELVAALAGAERPVVLVGDFNSAADGSGTASYGILTAAYADAFPSTAGPTCCQAADLLNEESELTTRIDLILTRGDAAVLSTDVVGEEVADKTPGGLWPSDHAGVVATLRLGD